MTAGPALDRPQLALEDAIRALRTGWGIDAQLTPLDGERDLNFAVHQGGTPLAVLKVVHPGEPGAAIEMQAALLEHLEHVAPDLPVPRVRRSREGEPTYRHGALRLRLVSWCRGTPVGEVPRETQLLRGIGDSVGRLTRALQSFGHPGAHRPLAWDIRRSGESAARLVHIPAEKRSLVEQAINTFELARPALDRVRHAVLHGDLNDWNLLADPERASLTGIIDFGDAIFGPAVADLAIAVTYAAMGSESPLQAMSDVVAGYAGTCPLEDDEIELIPALVQGRLATSLTISAERRSRAPSTAESYWFVSEAPAWALLEALHQIPQGHLRGALRKAARRPASRASTALRAFLSTKPALAPILGQPLAQQAVHALSWSSPNDPMVPETAAGDLPGADAAYAALQSSIGFDVGLGRWGEQRAVYTSAAFTSRVVPGARRDMHLGLDLFAPAGTPLFAPLAARVIRTANCDRPQDYGGVLLLEHDLPDGHQFRTLWGHLDPRSIEDLAPGHVLAAGDRVGTLGDSGVNGGWVPHLHLQLCLTNEEDPEAIIGVGESALTELWAELYPDPAQLAGVPTEVLTFSAPKRIGPAVSVSSTSART
ncbi:MAG: phosphotransferase [Gemmatimonadetes bacterium]|nr:phosphotransferase [Gemmatimonadota bacterium]